MQSLEVVPSQLPDKMGHLIDTRYAHRVHEPCHAKTGLKGFFYLPHPAKAGHGISLTATQDIRPWPVDSLNGGSTDVFRKAPVEKKKEEPIFLAHLC